MTRFFGCHDSAICEIWLICVSWLIHIHIHIHTGAMTHFLASSKSSSSCAPHIVELEEAKKWELEEALFQWNMTHSYVWRDSLTCESWLVYLRVSSHVCVITHWYVCRDSFLASLQLSPCVILLIHVCAVTSTYVCVPWLIPMWTMSHQLVSCSSLPLWHDSFVHVQRLKS